jgi:hypothetical protein
MAEPIVIAHLTGEDGRRLCGAPDGPLALEVSVELLTDTHWPDRTSVARCGRCVQIFRRAPIPA